LQSKWQYKRLRIRRQIIELLNKRKKMSKNSCIAAVQESEKKTNGCAPSYELVAAVLDEMADEKKVIIKQYNGKRSEGAWYTIIDLHAQTIVYLLQFEEPMASVEIKLKELRHSYHNLPKPEIAKRIAVLLRTCEYLSFMASACGIRLRLMGHYVENANTIFKMQHNIDKLHDDIIHFIYVDLWTDPRDVKWLDTINREYIEAKPDLNDKADPQQIIELWENAEKKPLWEQLSECGGWDCVKKLLQNEEVLHLDTKKK
jgi:hypothetical protein